MGRPITEEAFNSWEKRRFPNAALEFGPIYNFDYWISRKAAMCGVEITTARFAAKPKAGGERRHEHRGSDVPAVVSAVAIISLCCI